MKRLLAIIAFLHLYIFTFCASAQDRSEDQRGRFFASEATKVERF